MDSNFSTEVFTRVTTAVYDGVDWISFAIVIFGGLIAKYRLKEWKLNAAYKTLIVGTVLITVYVGILNIAGTLLKEDAPKFLFGYITATALYPILIKPFIKWFEKSDNA